jgi:hypothetical protein
MRRAANLHPPAADDATQFSQPVIAACADVSTPEKKFARDDFFSKKRRRGDRGAGRIAQSA